MPSYRPLKWQTFLPWFYFILSFLFLDFSRWASYIVIAAIIGSTDQIVVELLSVVLLIFVLFGVSFIFAKFQHISLRNVLALNPFSKHSLILWLNEQRIGYLLNAFGFSIPLLAKNR